MLLFTDIENRVIVQGFDGTSTLNQYNNEAVKALFAQAYEGSLSLAVRVLIWLNDPANVGKNIEITYLAGVQPGSPGYVDGVYSGLIFLTPEQCADIIYITEDGEAVRASALSVLGSGPIKLLA